MPQLKSGRHIGLLPPGILSLLRNGKDFQVYGAIFACRLTVHSVEQLPKIVPVMYFEDGAGTPPDAPSYHSGFMLQDILDGGGADWTDAERGELRDWLASDPRGGPWLQKTFDDIETAIRTSLVWTSEFVTDEPEEGTRH